MGLTPEAVLAMPFHDYQAALYHFSKAQGGEKEVPEVAADDYNDMMASLAGAGMLN